MDFSKLVFDLNFVFGEFYFVCVIKGEFAKRMVPQTLKDSAAHAVLVSCICDVFVF